ncbi:MAG: ATP synthase F0 subunit B [Desulfobacteraceae bacterium]|jgi:F-type H+-transporting ATPase subunit b|nr:ATP synthase F0 subunit B [Desulfobacteraceae bacterium]
MVSVDGSVFIQIVNFLFLVWVLNLVLYRPIRNVIRQRKEKEDGLKQNIDALGEAAREKDEAFASGIREARARGLRQKEALMAEAAEEEKRIIAEINERAQAELAAVREKLAGEVGGVRAQLEKELDAFADAIGQKILGRAV